MLFSIIIPLYNKGRSIGNTLNSVLSQSYQDFEVVVVDDGSTDNGPNEVRGISDSRIRLISQINSGVSSARNKGIKDAKGSYIAFLDADDEWDKNYLLEQSRLIEQFPYCDVFATDYLFQKPYGVRSNTIINRLPTDTERLVLESYFHIASNSHPPLWTSAVVVKKTALEAIGGFPIGIRSGEDLLTWARLAARYKIAYNRRPLAIFNVEGYDVKEKPKRIPAEDDVVGRELKTLAEDFDPPYIREYISLWHKMRSAVYMRLGMRRKSICEAFKGLRNNPLNYKLYAFCLLNLLPSKLQPFR